jgi:hypothetical protein
MKVKTFNTVFRGELEPEYREDRIMTVNDIKVPGPGAYDIKVKKDPSILKISAPTPKTKQYQDWVELAHVKVPIGP